MLILDIGCGNGLVRTQMELNSQWIVDGVDIDYNILKTDQNLDRKGVTYFYNINETNVSLKEKYDMIILFDVLEHIAEPLKFIEFIKYHLKEDGLIFINVPALEFLRSKFDSVVGHIIRYNKKNLLQTITKSNLLCISSNYWGFFLIPIAIMRKLYLNFVKDENNILQTGLKPPANWINKFLKLIMKLELKLTINPILGTSILLIAKKTK
jgi:SAM-dependent methyltransferase